ncbi:MAG: hypothetical protein ACYDAL_17155 [Candidatus Dormibacteraceae bacterium]
MPRLMAIGGNIDRRLGKGAVLDLQGREVSLSHVLQQGPVVLVWLRHYG